MTPQNSEGGGENPRLYIIHIMRSSRRALGDSLRAGAGNGILPGRQRESLPSAESSGFSAGRSFRVPPSVTAR